jgi:RNA polymerase sigma-70 factor (ECF subfamily)
MNHEDRLVLEILEGKSSSFELLLRPYRQGFLNMAYRMTGNREEAKEICQEALLRIFKYLKTFQKGRSFKAWAYKVLMNTSYDFLKEKKKFERVIDGQKESVLNKNNKPERRRLRSEIGKKIQEVLKILTPKEKAVFLLREGEDLSVEDTSLVLGCSQKSVRTHLCRARKKIKGHFEKFDPETGRR